MTTASVSILEAIDSNVSRLNYDLQLMDANGAPLPAHDVLVTVEGDGSLSHAYSSKEVRRETDAHGRTRVTWYRRSIFGRAVKATLAVTTLQPDQQVTLTPVTETNDGGWISYEVPAKKWF